MNMFLVISVGLLFTNVYASNVEERDITSPNTEHLMSVRFETLTEGFNGICNQVYSDSLNQIDSNERDSFIKTYKETYRQNSDDKAVNKNVLNLRFVTLTNVLKSFLPGSSYYADE